MIQYDIIPIEYPGTLVTVLPEEGRIEFTGPDGSALGPAMESSREHPVSELAELLTAMYVEIGQGEFGAADMARIGQTFRTARFDRQFELLEAGLPAEVMYRCPKPHDGVLRFGDFAVASQVPFIAQTTKTVEARNAAMPTMMNANHAIIKVGDEVYRLDIGESRQRVVMAVRVIELLRAMQLRLPEGDTVKQNDIAMGVWQSMTAQEQQLFIKPSRSPDPSKVPLSASNYVSSTLNSLTGLIGITHRASTTRQAFCITGLLLDVEVNELPPDSGQAWTKTIVHDTYDWRILQAP